MDGIILGDYSAGLNALYIKLRMLGGQTPDENPGKVDVWSQHLMVRIYSESFRSVCPDFTDVLTGCETYEGFESAGVVVGIHKVCQVYLELFMAVIMVTFDGGLLNCPVYSLDLAICSGMPDFGEAVLNTVTRLVFLVT